jgi:hypothetical protein
MSKERNMYIVFAVLLLLLLLLLFYNRETIVQYDGHPFIKTNNEETMRRLVDLRRKLQTVVDYVVRNNYPDKEKATLLKKRWSGIVIGDLSEWDVDAAYILNGGQELRVCTSPANDDNALTYVGLHELAHLMTARWLSHGADFRQNFDALRTIAQDLTSYHFEDYSSRRQNFCGTWL